MERSEALCSEKEQRLHWHPAFYAGMQIELQDEADKLTFEEEYLLGKEPLRMDMLLIKKNTKDKIKKNIGQIFRKYNIIEYKSPTDYLSVDDFYKVQAYAMFYKAKTGKENQIPIEELTLTFVCNRYPKSLLKHLKRRWYAAPRCVETGIYYLKSPRLILPVQIIVTKELTDEKNLWLHNLTNSLRETSSVKKLLSEYEKQKRNTLYQAVMEIIVNANKGKFSEVNHMCNALLEIVKDDLAERERIGEERGKVIGEQVGEERGRIIGEERGRIIGEERGKVIGEVQGETRVNRLILKLSQLGRNNDIVKSASDREYQKKLFAEFGL